MAETQPQTIGELREEAVRVLLTRIARSAGATGTDATKIRDLAQAVAFLES